MKRNEAPEIDQNSTPLDILILLFAAVLCLLVEETDKSHHQYLEMLDAGPLPLPDMTVPETLLFLAIIIQMGMIQGTH
jgi:hypothetical protein